MAVKFFGQFLLEKEIITREALLKAIALQDSTNLKFGEMAGAMGLITTAQIERVHDAQRSEDLPFGDMCVKLGILPRVRMDAILAKQKADHLFLGDALVNVGAIKADELQKHLDAFKANQAPYVVNKVAVPEGLESHDLWEAAADLTYKMLSRVAHLTVRPEPCEMVMSFDAHDMGVAMRMTGSVNARYMLLVSTDVRNAIARAMLKTSDISKEREEMLIDTVKEFANIICGNIAAKAAQMGIKIEIEPPEYLKGGIEGIPVPAGGRGLLLTTNVAEGRIAVGIFLEKS